MVRGISVREEGLGREVCFMYRSKDVCVIGVCSVVCWGKLGRVRRGRVLMSDEVRGIVGVELKRRFRMFCKVV